MGIIVFEGTPGTKVVKGQERMVVPLVKTDGEGGTSQFGIGLQYTDGGRGGVFWGLAGPRLLIRSWRAMRILEHVPMVGAFTLCACWYAAGATVHASDQRCVDELAAQFGSPDSFEALRREVLASVPTADEFDHMLTVIRDYGIEVATRELVELIELGALPRRPIVDDLVRREADQRDAYEQREAFIAAPVHEPESLGLLFAELGIADMLDGVPFGAYGMDWGHITLEELDAYVKRYSTGHNEGHQFTLLHTAGGRDGEVEPPWFIAADGTRYTFLDAKYEGGLAGGFILVLTKVESAGHEPEERLWDVPQLRLILGPIPVRRTWRRSRVWPWNWGRKR